MKIVNNQYFSHIEVSQLICKGNQTASFFMRERLVINGSEAATGDVL